MLSTSEKHLLILPALGFVHDLGSVFFLGSMDHLAAAEGGGRGRPAGRCSLEEWPTGSCSQAAGTHLETGESDKGILELFGGYSSLLKKDMHMGACPRYSVQWKKPGIKQERQSPVPCFFFFICVHTL